MLSKMVVIEPWFVSWEDTAVIILVLLQNSMDLLKSEPGSSNESCITSALDANELIVIEDGRVLDISEEADQEAA